MIVKELDIRGRISQIPCDWRTAIHRVATGRVRTEELVTHVYPLEEWYAGFEMAATRSETLREAIKR